MNSRSSWLLLLLALSCHQRNQELSTQKSSSTTVTHSPPSSAPSLSKNESPPSSPTALSNQEFGSLLQTISETGGTFPSDNYISNETSFLHVATTLETFHGGAYLGVGPEQNFTYIAMVEPELAFLIDIRRDNMILHLLYKTLFETSPTRADFLAQLTSRPQIAPSTNLSIDKIIDALQILDEDGSKIEKTYTQVLARAETLEVKLTGEDRKHLREALRAFAKNGMEIRYTMKGSSRGYPSLGELMGAKDEKGKQRSFLATEELYQKVRRMQQTNRIIPVVGDLAGTKAIPKLADELKTRKLSLQVFYASNVEQYLFSPSATWQRWLKNLQALPWANNGILVRVYFDQGRSHPEQQPGHRTTSLVQPAAAFLDRAKKIGWKSWWDVVQPQ